MSQQVMVLFLGCFLLNSCNGPERPCVKEFTISGVVRDEAGNPIFSADVVDVGHYGNIFVVKKTKSDGTYSFPRGRYSSLGNEYIIFRKEGYQEISTESHPIGEGNGCHDQVITRNAVMKVAP